MSLVGAGCAVLAVFSAIAACRRVTDIERRLALLLPGVRPGPRWRPVTDRDLEQSAIRCTQTDLAAASNERVRRAERAASRASRTTAIDP